MADKEKPDDTERLHEACARLPEAPALAFTAFQTPAGFTWHLTVRAGLPADLTAGALSQVREAVELIEKAAAHYKWLPIVDGRDSVGMPQSGGNAPPAAQLPPARQGGNGNEHAETLTFKAKSLTATVQDGKAYWKVKGGRFSKYGVTIWPEILEDAGYFVSDLDPMDQYDLSEYTARYVEKDGKPDKVVELIK